jgi:chitodextrinase
MAMHVSLRKRWCPAAVCALVLAIGGAAPAAAEAASSSSIAVFQGMTSFASTSTIRTVALSKPSATAANDLLVAVLATRMPRTATVNTVPTGWQLVRKTTHPSSATPELTQYVYAKRAGSSEPSSYSWTFSSYRHIAGIVLAYSGVSGNKVAVEAWDGQHTASTASVAAPSITTAGSDRVVLGLFSGDGTGSMTAPAAMTEFNDVATSGGTSAVTFEAADLVQASAGATGSQTASSSITHGSAIGQLAAIGAANAAGDPINDTTAPSTPTGLAATAGTRDSISVAWTASTDNLEVTGYGRYRDSTLVSSGTGTSYTFTGLSCNTAYTFGIDAYDAAGNRSGTATVNATTRPCTGATPAAQLPAGLAASTGTVYYVSTSGSDSNAGTISQPWLTVQKALDTLQPGEKALVRAGTYAQDLVMSRAGTSSAPLTIAAYPGETATLHAASTSGDTWPIRFTTGAAYVRVQGFVIENAIGTSSANVYVAGTANHIEISDSEIRYSQDQGIFTEATTSYVHLLRNDIHDNGWNHAPGQHQSHGIYIEGANHLMANNAVYDHPYGFGIQIYDDGNDMVVVNNTITGAGHSGIVVGGSGGVYNITIRNNVIASNSAYGVNMSSTCPTSGVVIDSNVFYSNPSGSVKTSVCQSAVTVGWNHTGDPLFVDYANRDLRLQSSSPAVDYGLSDWAPVDDLAGRTRPDGASSDAGAHEYDSP